MKLLRKIRSIGTFWMADRTMHHLEKIRLFELEQVLSKLPKTGRILEIGAGSGWQARNLEERGFDVTALDLDSSNYSDTRVWRVEEYDGKNIPYNNNTFDIAFSSNVFEHIPHVEEFQKELHRVLKDDGIMVHVMPSSSWRFWTNITHLLRNWTIPKVHGEHAGNSISEIGFFRSSWWKRMFQKTGWEIIEMSPNNLFYTGCSIMDKRLSISTRNRMSKILGSSCNIFVAKKKQTAEAPSPLKNQLKYVQLITMINILGEFATVF